MTSKQTTPILESKQTFLSDEICLFIERMLLDVRTREREREKEDEEF